MATIGGPILSIRARETIPGNPRLKRGRKGVEEKKCGETRIAIIEYRSSIKGNFVLPAYIFHPLIFHGIGL